MFMKYIFFISILPVFIAVTPTGPSDQPTSLIPSPAGLRVVSATSTDLTVSWNPAIGINKYRLILRNLADRQETLQVYSLFGDSIKALTPPFVKQSYVENV